AEFFGIIIDFGIVLSIRLTLPDIPSDGCASISTYIGSKAATPSSIAASNRKNTSRKLGEDVVKSNAWYALCLPLFFSLLLLTGCSGTSNGGTTTGGGGGGGGGGGAVGQAIIVNVSGGQTTSGVDIVVASPASSPTPNAENLGTGNSASNTGATIPQGTTATVLLFGPGLNGSMQVTSSGPADIAISNIQSITS